MIVYPIKTNEFKKYGKITYRLLIKKCLWCKKEFKTTRKVQKFCSNSCGNKNRWAAKRPFEPKGTRCCTKCKRVLSISAFYNSKKGRGNKQSSCKFCRSIYGIALKHKITKDQFINLLEIQNWNCALCGDTMKEVYLYPEKINHKSTRIGFSIDHIDPKGGDIMENYQATHWKCNTIKWNLTMEELYDWCEKVLKNKFL